MTDRMANPPVTLLTEMFSGRKKTGAGVSKLMAFGFGFNKQKALSAAENSVQQGKLQNAIGEYKKVLKADPKELTVSNTIGDLYPVSARATRPWNPSRALATPMRPGLHHQSHRDVQEAHQAEADPGERLAFGRALYPTGTPQRCAGASVPGDEGFFG